jgi:hypothetical protein
MKDPVLSNMLNDLAKLGDQIEKMSVDNRAAELTSHVNQLTYVLFRLILWIEDQNGDTP